MNKDLLSISEMAQLRNMTPETLRHYDRIGLIKPHYVEPSTGYRHYSIHQYEVLGTIRELKEIGLSLEEIMFFLKERNLEKSRYIMEAHQKKLQQEIIQLTRIESSLDQKLNNLKSIVEEGVTAELDIRYISDRYFLTTGFEVTNDIELSYAAIEMERLLGNQVSLVASSFLGLMFDAQLQTKESGIRTSTLVAQISFPDEYTNADVLTISGGFYVCLRHLGQVWNREECLSKMMEFIDKENMGIVGPSIQMVKVDVSITDRLDESLFEIQIPVSIKNA